ncbi:type IV pilus secretin PilQ [Desulfobacula toluolica]|uniref:PilQ: type IV pilus secretin n=1 Tax=Desulfobacula toluolica (strain DSM 7467 / Tol2) TaxID=651182 RepID=K0NCZ0_DESTT|nr:type IV pilus secretin PilQ [Desulfobacula toluolica]CCK78756.1 PilQ: type IV pilus secretin [Desulfobacula toluolica Tol2]
MFFFQIKRINNIIKLLGFLGLVCLIVGCGAQKIETVTTAEQIQPQILDRTASVFSGKEISAVSIALRDNVIEIMIQGNQKLVGYASIKQPFPFGIAVYFPETQIADGLTTSVPENNSIGDLIVNYADEDKTTAKVEILLKEELDYDVMENDNVLKLTLFRGMETNQQALTGTVNSVPALADNPSQERVVSKENIIIPGKLATMTDIEFNTMENGKSDIVVQTTFPVKYDIIRGSNDKLYLNLYNTIIPEYHKRPILTHYFKSAVKSLLPVQVPGEKKNSKIEIEIREQVPYRIVQDQNIISLFFEPSTMEPPVFSKAKKTINSGEQLRVLEGQKKNIDLPGKTAAIPDKKKTIEEEIFGSPKKYTGEKIKLDFYETDIKNVFRILKSIGGLNFAIDQNVEGKVTLSLEDPLPWDQVLDLVLKMNNLGQKKEGNVIRIATLDTLKKDEQLEQDAIAARKKSLEQKKSLEPLVTEYMPINYSDAEADIKPHIDQILTKDRGKISVDKRTNMIIFTDTQAKVDQAREIIFRLDKVTPQIMIEAKIVEVTKNFSRALGIGFSFSESQTPHTGYDEDFNIALNNPSGSGGVGNFNFYRILGSNFLSMNAQIAASETKGDLKIVSSPRILTLDNKSAKITQGLEYGYLERDDTGGSSVSFKTVNLQLEVTPHVTQDKRISMVVHLTKNDIGDIINSVPSVTTNEAQTELLVNDNDTIVIGGIVKTSDNKGRTGAPILSEIPVLGRLFRTDTNTDNRNELLIFITPSIVQLEQKRNNLTTTIN